MNNNNDEYKFIFRIGDLEMNTDISGATHFLIPPVRSHPPPQRLHSSLLFLPTPVYPHKLLMQGKPRAVPKPQFEKTPSKIAPLSSVMLRTEGSGSRRSLKWTVTNISTGALYLLLGVVAKRMC